MKFGKVSKTKDLNEYDDVRIVGKTFPHDEAKRIRKCFNKRIFPAFQSRRKQNLRQIYDS